MLLVSVWWKCWFQCNFFRLFSMTYHLSTIQKLRLILWNIVTIIPSANTEHIFTKSSSSSLFIFAISGFLTSWVLLLLPFFNWRTWDRKWKSPGSQMRLRCLDVFYFVLFYFCLFWGSTPQVALTILQEHVVGDWTQGYLLADHLLQLCAMSLLLASLFFLGPIVYISW